MAFKDALKRLREKKGLSQEELAKETGLSKSAISMYETGNREPKKLETLELLADYFNVDMNTLTDKNKEAIPVFDDPDIRLIARKSLNNDPKKIKKLRRVIEAILSDDEDDD